MRLYPDAFGLLMFAAVFLLLMFGYPVAFTLVGTGIAFAFVGHLLGLFDLNLLAALPLRIVGLMENDLLQAVPLFLYLGVVLQRTTLAADLLEGISGLFGKHSGGLGVATIVIGALLAPMTGAVGATVLTIGLLALPSMLTAGYDRRLASGIVCSAGTLGTILPPSIVLILLGSFMQSATIEAQLARGQLVTQPLTIKDIYLGALGPVGVLLCLYLLYVVTLALLAPRTCPPLPAHAAHRPSIGRLLVTLVIPLSLLLTMLGLIVTGYAYTVEAAAAGAIGTTIYAFLRGEVNLSRLAESVRTVIKLTAMVFLLLMGASTFSLIFRGLSGDIFVTKLLSSIPGGTTAAVATVMVVIFGLGFFLDALEIVFLVIPIAMPPLLLLGVDPLWLSVLAAVNLQTSFLAPPFGFALFFLRVVAPPEISTMDIYRGVVPFIGIQIVGLGLVWFYPAIVTTMPALANAPAIAAPAGGPLQSGRPRIIPMPQTPFEPPLIVVPPPDEKTK